jgi:hypothetical protein
VVSHLAGSESLKDAPAFNRSEADERALVENPTPVDLASFTDVRRMPIRPKPFRGPGFDEAFDATTLYFDAFWHLDGRRIFLLGPALFNLAADVQRAKITALPSGQACRFRTRSFDRHERTVVEAPPRTTQLRLNAGFGTVMIEVGQNRSELFAGRRVLLTLSKDNPIDWVLDWVRYHRDLHGADAILFYDNASASYSAHTLQESLSRIAGIAVACVVQWPFKYGPQAQGPQRWDSDFCQNGALEHARWRYLAQARSVMNGDVDELVVAPDRNSAFEAAERSASGLVRYQGAWVTGIRDERPDPDAVEPERLVRHKDFATRERPRWQRRHLIRTINERACPHKWTVVPRRCPERAQWRAHRIANWPTSWLTTSGFEFRHFRPISTNWKYSRLDHEGFSPELHERDELLASSYERVNWYR